MLVGKNIRYLRRRAMMSQDQLAEKLGFKSYTTIQKWESEVNEPSIGIITAIAEIFRVSLDDLIRIDMEKTRYDLRPSAVDRWMLSGEEYGDKMDVLYKLNSDSRRMRIAIWAANASERGLGLVLDMIDLMSKES